jgi:hypothetical protein
MLTIDEPAVRQWTTFTRCSSTGAAYSVSTPRAAAAVADVADAMGHRDSDDR